MAEDGVLISLITTVKNEERGLPHLIDSVLAQEGPLEMIVIDSDSEDRTCEIVREYARDHPWIRLLEKPGTRSYSRKKGIEVARGDWVAFVDGDIILHPFWAREMRIALQASKIVAGKTIQFGYESFETLERVEMTHEGSDVTHPSCNLIYHKSVLKEVGGFDPWFITGEDIDLNYRSVQQGHHILYNPKAMAYHKTRGTFTAFFKQAFWNGAGRKQLGMKHQGNIAGAYEPLEIIKAQNSFWGLARLMAGMLGFVGYTLFGEPRPED